ncbi:MAG: trigger factor [Geminicoccaceae bacterium]
MQVTEIGAEGLKREFKIVVPASEIQDRMDSRLKELAKTLRVPGFRPGKAPLPLLKKQHGRSVMGEILEKAVDEGAKSAVADNNLRPALRPKIEITSFDEGKDLEFQVNVEVLPEVPAVDVEGIELTRQTVAADPERVQKAVETFARSRQKFVAPETPRPAADGDQVVIDFEGTIDGEKFEGGAGKDLTLALGANAMIPGFEQQLIGATAGETRTITVTFPEDYGHKPVAGKEAVFTVEVKQVKEPVPYTLDDDWAKELGFEDLAEVNKTFAERFGKEYGQVSRAKMKRALLDHLAEKYAFEVPPGMVELEFDSIWKQLKDDMERGGQTFESTGEDEEKLKGEYRSIAERRVRLGLLLSDIGTKNEVTVDGQELQRAVMAEAQRYPGQERQVFEFFRSNPGALEQLRAPLFEDKVCDFIFAKAKVTDEPVSVEELMKQPDDEADETPAAA